ncbi:MAG TPA: Asp-tRNA(Asn)/Glu-tRNA(Gln) amidotransferase subunit GatA [Allosphingosinicella sp.]|nr:Asp-tRNA(Asn)/Glu-tRNA(Gln) amidotransferase subunit GatA [Allosphingosinicella sp.]
MKGITSLDVAEIRDGVRNRVFTAREVASAFIAAASEAADLNAFIVETPELALAAADAADAAVANGRAMPLAGVPIGIKDNYCLAGVPATAGSKILRGFIPTYTATVAQSVLEAGAICIGKTNMDEFGMGSSTENSAYGVTRNPAAANSGLGDVVAGGSSGGAAAAVAGKLVAASLASDTGGSIRQPASFCGVVGYKPTYGLASRWGLIAYASSLDQAGVIARTVLDTAIIADQALGLDLKDSTSLDWANPGLENAALLTGNPCRVGIPRQLLAMGGTADLRRCWEAIQNVGAIPGWEAVEVDLPSIGYALPAYYVIALCEASSNLSRYDGTKYGLRVVPDGQCLLSMYEETRSEGFSSETKKRILLGTFALSAGYYEAYYLRAAKVRRKIADEIRCALEAVDVIALPTAPTPAFGIGGHQDDPLEMYLEDVFTVPLNLTGFPGISIPGPTAENGLPMGIQLFGRALADDALFSHAATLERALANRAITS